MVGYPVPVVFDTIFKGLYLFQDTLYVTSPVAYRVYHCVGIVVPVPLSLLASAHAKVFDTLPCVQTTALFHVYSFPLVKLFSNIRK